MLKIIDATNFKLASLLGEAGWSRRFAKYWGNNGTVFNKRVYIYPKHHVTGNANTTKLLKMMGSYNDVMAMDPKGVESMWLYLNPEKLTASSEDYFTSYFIAQLIENNMVVDQWYNFTLNYTLEDKALLTMNGIDLYNYTKTNWSTIHSTLYSTSNTREMVRLSELSKFFFYEQNEQDFVMEYINAKKTVGTVFKSDPYDPDSIIAYNRKVLQATVAIDFRVKRVSEIGEDSNIVNKIISTSNALEKSMILQNSQMGYNSEDMSWSWFEPLVTDEIWLNSQLRVETWNNLKFKDRSKLISFVIDQDYQEEDTDWWEDLLVIVIVIVVIYFTGPEGGAWTASALAYTATMVALTMTIVSAVAANNGNYALAEFAGNIGKVAGFIAMAAGLVNMTNQLSTAMKTAATEAAKNESLKFIAQHGIETATTEAAKAAWTTELASLGSSDMLGVIIENALSTGTDGFMNMANKGLSIVNKLYEMYSKNELEDIKVESESLDKQMNEFYQEDALEDNNMGNMLYQVTLNPLTTISTYQNILNTKIDNLYYTEADYQGDRFNVMVSGPYKGIHLV